MQHALAAPRRAGVDLDRAGEAFGFLPELLEVAGFVDHHGAQALGLASGFGGLVAQDL